MGLSIASPYLLYETQVGSQYIKIHILHCGVITALRRESEVSEKKVIISNANICSYLPILYCIEGFFICDVIH